MAFLHTPIAWRTIACLLVVVIVAWVALRIGKGNGPSEPKRDEVASDLVAKGPSELVAPNEAVTGNSDAVMAVGPVFKDDERPKIPSRYGVPTKADAFSRAARLTIHKDGLGRLRRGDSVQLDGFDGAVFPGRVGATKLDEDGQVRVVGALSDGGTFYLSTGPRGAGGRILPKAGKTVVVVTTLKGGDVVMLEKAREAVICLSYPKMRDNGTGAGALLVSRKIAMSTAASPIFNSRPDAVAVAYLDFDGEFVPQSEWAGGEDIEASPSGLSDEAIEEVWRRVAEDYRAFNINVTTDESRYRAAPVGSRMRCIITLSSELAPNSGGVAALGSWADAVTPEYFNDDLPCWVFSLGAGFSAKGVAEAVSHEIGHTLGLSHDGLKDVEEMRVEAYYEGRGSGATGWAPIMGAGYYQELTQWSRGDYVDGDYFGDNHEDDLAIIASAANNTRFTRDRVASIAANAHVIPSSGAGAGAAVGVIERSDDIDTYALTVGAGGLTVSVSQDLTDAAGGISNLDAKLELYDDAGGLLASADPQGSLFPSISTTVSAGTYYLKLSSVGEGNGTTDGYTNYASVGRYRIATSFVEPVGLPPAIVGETTVPFVQGVDSSYQVQATAGPVGFVAVGLPDGVSIHLTSGEITGVAPAAGDYPFTVRVKNLYGTASRSFVLRVSDGALAGAVDAPALAWASGGSLPWIIDTDVQRAGPSSARSGTIAQHYTQSWIETSVTGPGTLKFYWRVSCEENIDDPLDPFDRLEFAVNGLREAFISGEHDWAEYVYTVPAGAHTLRWTYQKDPYASEGDDAGWLDNVVYLKDEAPVITPPPTATTTVGSGYGQQVIATPLPTGYTATGLPPGLVLDQARGFISGIPIEAGSYTVTLGAGNSFGTDNTSFTLHVRSRLAAWAEGFGLIGSDAAATADPDQDGMSNLLEYAFGFSPVAANFTGGLFEVSPITVEGVAYLQLQFVRPFEREEITYTVEVSTDLNSTWAQGHAYGPGEDNTASLPTEQLERTTLFEGSELIRVREALPGAAPLKFMRLKISAP